jgi:8-oxo-dGTP diphosphatase
VGVGVIVRRGDQLLLQRRINSHGEGTWSSPGGHLDFGEEPAACAVREVAEETALHLGGVRFVGITNDVFDDERHYVTLWFVATDFAGVPTIAATDELSELDWFPLDDLPQPLFPPLRRLLAGQLDGPGL